MLALKKAVTEGRNGRGSIFVWAGGNGGRQQDNCNYDGYANNPFTIAIGAIGDDGVRASYSEECAALAVVAPSNGGKLGITTTDLLGAHGYSPGDCTSDFGGTSSAAPLVSGIVALMLSVNPQLGWKDVQYCLITSTTRVDPLDKDWKMNGAGYYVSHKYGYGLVDANASVYCAKNYKKYLSVEPYSTKYDLVVNKPIPQAGSGHLDSVIVVNDEFSVEHVQVILTASHPSVTELDVKLISPFGTESVLAELRAFVRKCNFSITSPSELATESIECVTADFGVADVGEIEGDVLAAHPWNG